MSGEITEASSVCLSTCLHVSWPACWKGFDRDGGSVARGRGRLGGSWKWGRTEGMVWVAEWKWERLWYMGEGNGGVEGGIGSGSGL